MERKITLLLPFAAAILLASVKSEGAMVLLNDDAPPHSSSVLLPTTPEPVSVVKSLPSEASKEVDLPPEKEKIEPRLLSSSGSQHHEKTKKNLKKSTKKDPAKNAPPSSFDISPNEIGAQVLSVPSSFNLDPSRDASLRETLVRWGVLAGGWRVVWEGTPKTFQMPADFGGDFRIAVDALKRATGLEIELYEGNQVVRVISR